jgi:hypothetical protein
MGLFRGGRGGIGTFVGLRYFCLEKSIRPDGEVGGTAASSGYYSNGVNRGSRIGVTNRARIKIEK